MMHGKMIRPSTSIGNNGLPGEKSGWKRARKCGRVFHKYIDGKEGEIIGETGVFREFFKFFSLLYPDILGENGNLPFHSISLPIFKFISCIYTHSLSASYSHSRVI